MGFQETFNERVIPAGDRAFGLQVTLTHGPTATEAFTAQWEIRLYQIQDLEGFATVAESRDFMFDKASPTLDGTAVEPRAGDRVTLTENGSEVVYEVLPLGNLPAVESMDGGYRWRVHTKRVG